MSNAVFWFTNDLRLSDNLALRRACEQETHLDLVYCIDPKWMRPNALNCKTIGKHRYRFILEALNELNQQLKKHGQHLNVYFESPERLFNRLYNEHDVRRIYHSINAGYNERRFFNRIHETADDLSTISAHTHTLFEPFELPFQIIQLPNTFSKFRKKIETSHLIIKQPLSESQLPKPNNRALDWLKILQSPEVGADPYFNGGEKSGLAHVSHYFENNFAQSYKQTRNSLDVWEESTKFSPWLAIGCVSPRQVVARLKRHEENFGANESTYWILFELLWREYFQWYAHAHGAKLFQFTGINNHHPFTSFYGERFQRWRQGNTPFPIVNACMKQLNATGYMSNRGRQLVASCFIHELKLDWRYGAAYFEQQLIDYDVGSNWGNWQYLAGVGADPRGSRRFNLEKQTQTYDPEHKFINSWHGNTKDMTIDSVDAADWPINPNGCSSD
ncbi:MAG: DASH family cryptochrome [Gammaproteobacteria bacterium]|nr:DASH family cryptochrome [Gammaproteobacteria bacterium]